MKLYKVTAQVGRTEVDPIYVTKWTGTQAGAAALRKEANTKMQVPRDYITTYEVEVPTNKAGLIEFLNQL